MNNWAPRVGFNYRLTQKTVLRGGYSRTYDLIFNNIFLNIYSAFPFTQVVNLPAGSPNSYRSIYALGYQGAPAPAITNPLLVTRTIVANDFRSPYAEQFSFQVQRELGGNWALTGGWIGTKGTALFQSVDGNPTIPGTGGTARVNGLEGIRRLRANTALPFIRRCKHPGEAALQQLLPRQPLHLEHVHRRPIGDLQRLRCGRSCCCAG